MKKKIVIIAMLIIMILAVGYVGYSYYTDKADIIAKTVEAYDNSCSIKVPMSWSKSSGASPNAVIAVENRKSSMYAMVSIDRSAFSSGDTVEDYIGSYINRIAENSDNALAQTISVTPALATLGNNTGYYFELDTSADGLTLHMWDFVFNTDGGYIHIDVAAPGENHNDVSGIALGIINSLTIN